MPPIDIEEAIAAAERKISKLIDDYPRHMLAVLDEMQAAADKGAWDRVHLMAHDIKGQAATVGWPVLGAMAHSLQDSLESDAEGMFAESVRLHLASLRYCLNNRLAEVDREGARLLGDLRVLTTAMRARGRLPQIP